MSLIWVLERIFGPRAKLSILSNVQISWSWSDVFQIHEKLQLSAMFICLDSKGGKLSNPAQKCDIHCLSGENLSNRPQVSMVCKLINHAGCWWNTRRICKPRAAGSWFTNSSSVLPTSQVVYQPITHRKLVVYCFYIIIQKTRDFSVGLLAQ